MKHKIIAACLVLTFVLIGTAGYFWYFQTSEQCIARIKKPILSEKDFSSATYHKIREHNIEISECYAHDIMKEMLSTSLSPIKLFKFAQSYKKIASDLHSLYSILYFNNKFCSSNCENAKSVLQHNIWSSINIYTTSYCRVGQSGIV